MRTTLLIGIALVASLLVVPGVAADGGGGGAILCKFLANTACDLPERTIDDLTDGDPTGGLPDPIDP